MSRNVLGESTTVKRKEFLMKPFQGIIFRIDKKKKLLSIITYVARKAPLIATTLFYFVFMLHK